MPTPTTTPVNVYPIMMERLYIASIDPTFTADEQRMFRTAKQQLDNGVGGLARWAYAEDYLPDRPRWLAVVHGWIDEFIPDWQDRIEWESRVGW